MNGVRWSSGRMSAHMRSILRIGFAAVLAVLAAGYPSPTSLHACISVGIPPAHHPSGDPRPVPTGIPPPDQPDRGTDPAVPESGAPGVRVRTGADVLIADSLHLLKGRRIGLLCNHTSRLRDGTFLFDTLRHLPEVRLTAVFTPEHGFRGSVEAGALVASDLLDGIPLYSLYGNTRRPTPAMLAHIDLLVMDLQDIGVRYYTYVSTMAYCMEEAAAAGIPVLLLDRPNPLGGERIEGPIRADSLRSFVGYLPVPVRHGMTAGELLRMASAEGWLRDGAAPALQVLPMEGWRRAMYYDDTGLPWVDPSPNMRSLEAAIAYAGTCLLEGTNVSEGRGTDAPFLLFGAPFVDEEELASALEALRLPGVRFTAETFTPAPGPGARHPRFAGESCGGVRLRVTNRMRFRSWETGVDILRTLDALYHGKVTHTPYLILLAGHERVLDGAAASPARQRDAERFARRRLPYLLYP